MRRLIAPLQAPDVQELLRLAMAHEGLADGRQAKLELHLSSDHRFHLDSKQFFRLPYPAV